ncbi:hypothetical protein [Cryptosporangium japonicum]|uniref:Uncharacterized protein n=1 Tax=Cryptosporangium japonicum TaxID=80872 RepID=A0ABP3ECI7_9ACTN
MTYVEGLFTEWDEDVDEMEARFYDRIEWSDAGENCREFFCPSCGR